jgi:LysM repeat protein
MTGICPYLISGDGAWRSTTVAREHRCGATAPAALLAAEKQRRLCLTADYATCATYEAARNTRAAAFERIPTLPRPVARTAPVVLDHGRIAMPSLRSERVPGQALLVILLALAFAAILLARMTGGGAPAIAGGDPSATPAVSAASSAGASRAPASGRPSASTAPSTGASSSPAASGAGSPPPTAVASRTYKVKSGDTLVGIAAKFDTTPKEIAKLNGLKNPAALKVGQILQIP